MNAEDQPTGGDILPPPVEPGDVLLSGEVSHSQGPASPEARGNNVAAPPTLTSPTNAASASLATEAISDFAKQTDTAAPKPTVAGSDQTKDDLARRYDEEARKVLGRYAADPYLEVEKIEIVKQNYLRDVYNYRVKLPQM